MSIPTNVQCLQATSPQQFCSSVKESFTICLLSACVVTFVTYSRTFQCWQFYFLVIVKSSVPNEGKFPRYKGITKLKILHYVISIRVCRDCLFNVSTSALALNSLVGQEKKTKRHIIFSQSINYNVS